jgi:hypothetical protein
LGSKLSPLAADAAADMVCRLLDGGTLNIYGGSTLLAQLRFGDPAFGPAQDGKANATPITADPSARATGTATRFEAANGEVVFSGTVGTKEADLILDGTKIEQGAIVSVTSLTYQQGLQ